MSWPPPQTEHNKQGHKESAERGFESRGPSIYGWKHSKVYCVVCGHELPWYHEHYQKKHREKCQLPSKVTDGNATRNATKPYRIVPNQRTGAPKKCQYSLGVKSNEAPSKWLGHIGWTFNGWVGMDLDGNPLGPPREFKDTAALDVLHPERDDHGDT